MCVWGNRAFLDSFSTNYYIVLWRLQNVIAILSRRIVVKFFYNSNGSLRKILLSRLPDIRRSNRVVLFLPPKIQYPVFGAFVETRFHIEIHFPRERDSRSYVNRNTSIKQHWLRFSRGHGSRVRVGGNDVLILGFTPSLVSLGHHANIFVEYNILYFFLIYYEHKNVSQMCAQRVRPFVYMRILIRQRRCKHTAWRRTI